MAFGLSRNRGRSESHQAWAQTLVWHLRRPSARDARDLAGGRARAGDGRATAATPLLSVRTTATAFARVSVDDRELDLRLVGIEIEEELVHLIDDLLDPRVVPDDLVTTRITGRRDSSAFRGTKRVCGRGCGVRKRDRAADRGLSSVVIASLAQSHRVDCFRPSSLTRLVRRGAAVIRTYPSGEDWSGGLTRAALRAAFFSCLRSRLSLRASSQARFICVSAPRAISQADALHAGRAKASSRSSGSLLARLATQHRCGAADRR